MLCCCVIQVIKKDLQDCEAHITALETLVSSSPANKTKFERLYSDWKRLYKAVRVRKLSAMINDSLCNSVRPARSFPPAVL